MLIEVHARSFSTFVAPFLLLAEKSAKKGAGTESSIPIELHVPDSGNKGTLVVHVTMQAGSQRYATRICGTLDVLSDEKLCLSLQAGHLLGIADLLPDSTRITLNVEPGETDECAGVIYLYDKENSPSTKPFIYKMMDSEPPALVLPRTLPGTDITFDDTGRLTFPNAQQPEYTVLLTMKQPGDPAELRTILKDIGNAEIPPRSTFLASNFIKTTEETKVPAALQRRRRRTAAPPGSKPSLPPLPKPETDEKEPASTMSEKNKDTNAAPEAPGNAPEGDETPAAGTNTDESPKPSESDSRPPAKPSKTRKRRTAAEIKADKLRAAKALLAEEGYTLSKDEPIDSIEAVVDRMGTLLAELTGMQKQLAEQAGDLRGPVTDDELEDRVKELVKQKLGL